MAGPFGKYPGQSVTKCSGVLVPPFPPGDVLGGQPRPGRQQPLERGDVAALDGEGQFDSDLVGLVHAYSLVHPRSVRVSSRKPTADRKAR